MAALAAVYVCLLYLKGVPLLQTLCFDCTAGKTAKKVKKRKKETQNNLSAPAAQGFCPRACLHRTWNLNAGRRRRRRARHFIMLSRHGGIMSDECHGGTAAANKQAF